jgi:hypothetical protein
MERFLCAAPQAYGEGTRSASVRLRVIALSRQVDVPACKYAIKYRENVRGAIS